MGLLAASITVYSREDGTTDVSIKVWDMPTPHIGSPPSYKRVFKLESPDQQSISSWLRRLLTRLPEKL